MCEFIFSIALPVASWPCVVRQGKQESKADEKEEISSLGAPGPAPGGSPQPRRDMGAKVGMQTGEVEHHGTASRAG